MDILVNYVRKNLAGIIFIFLLTHLPAQVTGLDPGFVSPLENITVAAGRSAHFTCIVNNLGGHKVAWLRSDSKAILAIHTHMVTNNPRMTIEHNGHNSWTLMIDSVMRNDSGLYMCQINTEPMISQIGMLSVVEAPDILYNETSNDTVVAEGASVQLRCEARGFPEPTVTWRREDGTPIVLRGPTGTYRVDNVEGSELKLDRLTRADMGAYLCIASNRIPSPVSKRIMLHVHFAPMVKVREQIVSTRIGTTVTLRCLVESSPRSVNYWVQRARDEKDFDRAINPSRRFRPSEEAESMYTYVISLTIIDVKSSDFGNYSCQARNSLGTAMGTVELLKMNEPEVVFTESSPQLKFEATIDNSLPSYYDEIKTERSPPKLDSGAGVYYVSLRGTTVEPFNFGHGQESYLRGEEDSENYLLKSGKKPDLYSKTKNQNRGFFTSGSSTNIFTANTILIARHLIIIIFFLLT